MHLNARCRAFILTGIQGLNVNILVLGSPVQFHPNGQVLHQPPPQQCFNVVDSEGKDLNFFVQLGMEVNSSWSNLI